MRIAPLISAAFLIAAPLSAVAQESTHVGEVYSEGNWSVNVYQDDDGSLSCIAEVQSELSNLSIWAYESGEVFLNISSENWGFDPETETFKIEVDDMGEWSIGTPEITDGSVFVELADDKASADFLKEVSGGKLAYVRNPAGELLAEPFSLDGSENSMVALSGCVEGLTQ